nr:MAG TPA: hypothetical protein [Caudoviricetes sp.]
MLNCIIFGRMFSTIVSSLTHSSISSASPFIKSVSFKASPLLLLYLNPVSS